MSDVQDQAFSEPGTPGRELAAARAARGLTVTDIALRLKFSPRQIEALEADRYDALAGPAFVRGMVRAYAKLLGADADALVARVRASPLTAAGPTVTGLRSTGVMIPRQPRRGSLVYVLLSLLLVLAVAGVAVEWLLRPMEPPEVAAATSATAPAAAGETPAAPSATQAAEPTAAAALAQVPQATSRSIETVLTAKRIELDFNRESWVEIRDAEGKVVFSQLNPPGTRREVEGVAPFSLVIGNARGVRLRYNESDVDLAPFTRTDVARLTLD